MGHVFADVTLKNATDMGNARNGQIKEENVRSIAVRALVDTGATMLCMNEEIRQKLGLKIIGSSPIRIANGTWLTCQVTEPVEIIWTNRNAALYAYVVPGLDNALLGVIPLEAMDLIVNPNTQQLEGAHGDQPRFLAMSSFLG